MSSEDDSSSLFNQTVSPFKRRSGLNELFSDSPMEEVLGVVVDGPVNVEAERMADADRGAQQPEEVVKLKKRDLWNKAVRDLPILPQADSIPTSPFDVILHTDSRPTLAVDDAVSIAKPPLPIAPPHITRLQKVEVDEEIFSESQFAGMTFGTCKDVLSLTPPPDHTSLTTSPTASPAITPSAPTSSFAPVSHIVLVVHGVNGSEDYLYQNLAKLKESFEEVRSVWFSQTSTPSDFHMELVNWKSSVIGLQSSLMERITPASSAESRRFFNYAISDVAFYLTDTHCDVIKRVVTDLLNGHIRDLLQGEDGGRFVGAKISLVGYSLGSVIIHDILEDKRLDFPIHKLFFWGSPLAAYLSVKDSAYQTEGRFVMPKDIDVFNIYHPQDPVAFRIEPLYYYQESDVPEAQTVSYWLEGVSSWTNSFWSSSSSTAGVIPLGPKRRLDYVLQESVTESFSGHYSMITAHFSYWASRDVANFMIRRLTSWTPSATARGSN